VDVAKSVSRVGGKAQRAAYRAVTGDLKLAYAQFEELETFARFGARVDDETRKVIEHGRRIRACLNQPELSPVSVSAQIAILLALTANLFEPVPLNQMIDAEQAVKEAAAGMPAEVCRLLEAAAELSDADRNTIVAIARQALLRFYPKPEAAPEPNPDAQRMTRSEPRSEQEGGAAGKANPKAPREEKR
jgi:F-type H+-transporting ATPase subunit alpha